MAGTILTPSTIWNNFSINVDAKATVIDTYKKDGVSFCRVYIDGRRTTDGQVKIFGWEAKKESMKKAPAILMANNLSGAFDFELMTTLVNAGYIVLAIDVVGMKDSEEHFTIYPSSIGYANFQTIKDDLYYIGEGANKTCWYEWAVCLRYALNYLKNRQDVTKVGGLGIAETATAMWQVAGVDEQLDCACFALNAGWNGYRGIYKFDNKPEPQFSDNMYKFIAGIEPQSYAMHVTCPVFILSATNSNIYSSERAYDTITRIDKGAYKALNYSVGFKNSIDKNAFNSALVFFREFLFTKGNKEINLPSVIELEDKIVDGKVVVTATCEGTDISNCVLYVAEQTIIPEERCWLAVNKSKKKDGVYKFTYSPYPKSNIMLYFVQATYKNGITIASNVMARRFTEDEVAPSFKSKIIYSSRLKETECVWSVLDDIDMRNGNIDVIGKYQVESKKGPLDIVGISAQSGLLSFKINAQKDKPNENSILMFEIFSKESGYVTVSLYKDYFGKKIEYMATEKLVGGGIWQNVQIDLLRFKTKEGAPLKNIDSINAISFKADGEYLMNNALWL